MLKKVISILEWSLIFYCIIFTVATIVNSISALWFGVETNPDIHRHIMLRAGICLIITFLVTLIKYLPLKGKITNYIIVCLIALSIIIAFIWALTSGYLWWDINEVHPNAYRDLIRSVAIPFIIISAIVILVMYIKEKRKLKEIE